MKLLVYVYLNFIINEVLRLFGATRDVIFIQSKQFFLQSIFSSPEFSSNGHFIDREGYFRTSYSSIITPTQLFFPLKRDSIFDEMSVSPFLIDICQVAKMDGNETVPVLYEYHVYCSCFKQACSHFIWRL